MKQLFRDSDRVAGEITTAAMYCTSMRPGTNSVGRCVPTRALLVACTRAANALFIRPLAKRHTHTHLENQTFTPTCTMIQNLMSCDRVVRKFKLSKGRSQRALTGWLGLARGSSGLAWRGSTGARDVRPCVVQLYLSLHCNSPLPTACKCYPLHLMKYLGSTEPANRATSPGRLPCFSLHGLCLRFRYSSPTYTG